MPYEYEPKDLMTAEEARLEVRKPEYSRTGRSTLDVLNTLVREAARRGMQMLDVNLITGYAAGIQGNGTCKSLNRQMARWLDVNAGKLEEKGYHVKQYRDEDTGYLIRLVLIW